MADVFLSYAREDSDRAERLARAIEAHGWSVWWDSHIHAGHAFEDVIEQEIESARCVVVLWTRTSVASKWVRNEAKAGERRAVLIPVLLDDVRIPLAFDHLQTADLVGWNGEATPAFARFVASLEARLGGTRRVAEVPVVVPEAKRPPVRPVVWVVAAIAFIAVLAVLANLPSSPRPQNAVDAPTATQVTEPSPTTAPAVATQTEAPPPAAKKIRTAPVVEPPPRSTAARIAPGRQGVRLETSEGNIIIECFTDLAPAHASRFMTNAFATLYNGEQFDSVRPGVMIQAGSGFLTDLPPELGPPYEPGMVAFAQGQDDDSNTVLHRFFIWFGPNPPKGTYTFFGRVIAGMDVVERISNQQTIKIHKAVVL